MFAKEDSKLTAPLSSSSLLACLSFLSNHPLSLVCRSKARPPPRPRGKARSTLGAWGGGGENQREQESLKEQEQLEKFITGAEALGLCWWKSWIFRAKVGKEHILRRTRRCSECPPLYCGSPNHHPCSCSCRSKARWPHGPALCPALRWGRADVFQGALPEEEYQFLVVFSNIFRYY